MISVRVYEGDLRFSLREGEEEIPFAPDEREKLVHFLRTLLDKGWEGDLFYSSSMEFSEENGWPDGCARGYLSDVIREAEDAPLETAEPSETAALREVISTLRQKLRDECNARAALEREHAELEHENEQLCVAAVALEDERDELRKRLREAQDALLCVIAESAGQAGILHRSATDAPLGEAALAAHDDRNETMVAETEAALSAALEEPATVLDPDPSPALVALMQDDTDDAVADYMNARKPEAAALGEPEVYPDGSRIETVTPAPESTKRKKGRK